MANGCDMQVEQKRPKQTCPFCRQPAPKTVAESNKNIMKRIEEVNDPAAMRQLATMRYLEGDYASAFEYLTKAAGLGDS